MDLVNLSSHQILPDHRHAAADAYVLTARRILRLLQGGLNPVGHEIKRSAAFHLERSPRVMREHKHRRVIRRSLAPPPFPRVIRPESAHRAEHVATENEGAHIRERSVRKIVVDAT